MKWLKRGFKLSRWCLSIVLVQRVWLTLVILLAAISLYGGIWCYRFSQLATQYVEHRYDSKTKKVYYTFVSSPPAYWAPLSGLDQKAYGAIVISEDWGFYGHFGIDFWQIKDALWSFISRREKLRGASTITQQLIKNIYLTHERSLWRKAKEAFLALLVERVLSKKKILELYLNVIEYGKGVYGISNASMRYFGKPARNLTVREGAFLAVLLPDPKRYSQSFRKRELSKFITEGIQDVLKKMKVAGYLSEQELEVAIKNIFSWETRSFSMDDSQYFDLNDRDEDESKDL